MYLKPTSLFHLLFGPQAETVRAAATAQLLTWAELFDEWLAARQRASDAEYLLAVRTWKEFFNLCSRPPWDVQEADIHAYIDWHYARGSLPYTIRNRLASMSSFYEFACPRLPPAETLPNPLACIPRPTAETNARAVFLSPDEIHAFLSAIDRASPLGKRDYALLLAYLITGLNHNEIRQLQWQHLDVDLNARHAAAQRFLTPRAAPAQLPFAWVEAIWAYLLASGRLETIQPADHIFAPLHNFLGPHPFTTPAAWDATRPISTSQVNYYVRRYAHWAGLQEDQINPRVLRHTAVMLRLEAGDSIKEIQTFFAYARYTQTKRYIIRLTHQVKQPLWKTGAPLSLAPLSPAPIPHPASLPVQSLEPLEPALQGPLLPPFPASPPLDPAFDLTSDPAHALYASAIPLAELQQLAQTTNPDLAPEILAIRWVILRTLKSAFRTQDLPQLLRLLDTLTRSVNRLATLYQTQKKLTSKQNDLLKFFKEALTEVYGDQSWDDPSPDP